MWQGYKLGILLGIISGVTAPSIGLEGRKQIGDGWEPFLKMLVGPSGIGLYITAKLGLVDGTLTKVG